MNFLSSLASIHKHVAERDYTRLQDLKRLHTKNPSAILEPWDRLFYSQFVSLSSSVDTVGDGSTDPFHNPPHHDANDQISYVALTPTLYRRYFSVGSTFEGLSRLFTALYGISLVPAQIIPGEVWHDDIRKLHVVDEKLGKIGTVYCDLFIRNHSDTRKYENAVLCII